MMRATIHIRPFLLCSLCVVAVLWAANSYAGTINYVGPVDLGGGNTGFMDGGGGGTVWYGNVSESNDEDPNGEAASLFGAPVVTGNNADWNPQDFNASASDGSTDITDGQLNFQIMPMNGTTLESVTFAEAGDTTLQGTATSTDFTNTSVVAHVRIEVITVDGHAPVNPLDVQETFDMAFNPSDGTYGWLTDGGGGPFAYSEDWDGDLFIDLDDFLTDKGEPFVFGVTKLNVVVDNILAASSEENSTAFIQKKDFDGFSVIANIPEPTTSLLAVVGLLACAMARGRS